MWASLRNWIVQDGEIPELRPGDLLRDVALRAASWSLRESRDPEGVVQPQASGGGDVHIDTRYDLTGTVRAARAPGCALLRVGRFPIVAEPRSVRGVGGALERYSPVFPVPDVGARVTVACTLEVMAWYETDDAFVDVEEADLVHDWDVARIRLAHWARVPMPDNPRVRTTGPLLREEEITGMRRWADESEHEHVSYVLDLLPR